MCFWHPASCAKPSFVSTPSLMRWSRPSWQRPEDCLEPLSTIIHTFSQGKSIVNLFSQCLRKFTYYIIKIEPPMVHARRSRSPIHQVQLGGGPLQEPLGGAAEKQRLHGCAQQCRCGDPGRRGSMVLNHNNESLSKVARHSFVDPRFLGTNGKFMEIHENPLVTEYLPYSSIFSR